MIACEVTLEPRLRITPSSCPRNVWLFFPKLLLREQEDASEQVFRMFAGVQRQVAVALGAIPSQMAPSRARQPA